MTTTKHKQVFWGIALFLIAVIVAIIYIINLLIMPYFAPPGFMEGDEKLSKFKSININLSSQVTKMQYSLFYYSFIPDGSGILYVDVVFEAGEKQIKYVFHYLDFKSGKQEIIYEINFNENFTATGYPSVYWLNENIALIGGGSSLKLCNPENPEGAVIFNLKLRQTTPAHCVQQEFMTFYSSYTENKQFYTIYKITYYTGDDHTAYIFYNKDSTSVVDNYVIEDLLDGEILEFEKRAYKEFGRISLPPLTNKEFVSGYPGVSNVLGTKNWSRDKKYYLIWNFVYPQIDPGLEPAPEKYLEVYTADNRMVRRIYLGTANYWTGVSPQFIGYGDFWSNDNQIVIIPATDSQHRNLFKVYFIDPEK